MQCFPLTGSILAATAVIPCNATLARMTVILINMLTYRLLNLKEPWTQLKSFWMAFLPLPFSSELSEAAGGLRAALPSAAVLFFFFFSFGPFCCCYTKWKEEWCWEQISTNSFSRLLVFWSLLPKCCLLLWICNVFSETKWHCGEFHWQSPERQQTWQLVLSRQSDLRTKAQKHSACGIFQPFVWKPTNGMELFHVSPHLLEIWLQMYHFRSHYYILKLF